MSGASPSWRQMTFADLDAPISSPESAAGNSPCNSQDGPPAETCGRVRARANRTRRRASAKATPTSATCGPTSSGSSASAALSASLANRLKQRFGTGGSTEFVQTWKEKATPSGLVCAQYTASARRTSDNGSSGWPTQKASNNGIGSAEREMTQHNSRLVDAAQLAPWPTPMAQNPEAGNCDFTRSVEAAMGLRASKNAPLASWPTPTTTEHQPEYGRGNLKLNGAALLAGCSTPRATDGSKGGPNQTGDTLTQHAMLLASPWATPTVRDHKDGACQNANVPVNALLGRQAVLATSGPTPGSSTAETGKPAAYRLSPLFSLWLMGFPVAWASCGERAMRLCRSSRRSSSRPSSKQKGEP